MFEPVVRGANDIDNPNINVPIIHTAVLSDNTEAFRHTRTSGTNKKYCEMSNYSR